MHRGDAHFERNRINFHETEKRIDDIYEIEREDTSESPSIYLNSDQYLFYSYSYYCLKTLTRLLF